MKNPGWWSIFKAKSRQDPILKIGSIFMIFNKVTLKNGIRLITVPMPDNPSVTVLVMVEAGSKYETKNINGLSHFLEHMVFKGTERRPKFSDISRELDSIGANYNAFTSQEFTGYYAKADLRHLDKVMDIVSDMYLNPIFDIEEIKKEKGVIIEELRMYKDLPQQHVHDVMAELLHGDQPAGWNVIGTEETINSFTREHFMTYRKEHYVSDATIVVVAGSFDESQISLFVDKAFSGISTAQKKGKLPIKESQDKPAIRLVFKETDQTHLVIGLRTFPITDKRLPAMRVLTGILSGGMSSRLFSKMRDQLGICYYIRAIHSPATDHGDLTISAGVDNSRVEQGIRGIMEECERLKTELVSDEELKKVKDYIAGTTLLELETSDARAEFSGYQEVMKRSIESPAEIIAKTNAVSAEDVRNLAKEIFVNSSLNLAMIGKSKDESGMSEYFKFS